MKSKIYLILFALFAFSCSSDSSSDDGNNNNGGNNNTGNALLVSEINETNADATYTYRYFYDGNKLTSIVNEYSFLNENPEVEYIYNFIYTNNKISRIDEYYGDTSQGIEGRYSFEYDNQGRISYYDYCYFTSGGTCDYYDTNTFTYSSNGTVTNSYVIEDGSDYEEVGMYTLQLDNNGNIISVNDSYQYEDADGNLITEAFNGSLEFDNQNSPFKNIVGMDAIILTVIGENLTLLSPYNNCISYTADYPDLDEPDQYNFAYDYNEDGYPRQAIVTYSGGNFDGSSYTETIEFNYY
tara:strand:- start:286 stop:1173 length:888 start_codon:yes stop_codon:yes gene_type:complete